MVAGRGDDTQQGHWAGPQDTGPEPHRGPGGGDGHEGKQYSHHCQDH